MTSGKEAAQKKTAPDVLRKAEARDYISSKVFAQHAFDADCEDGGSILLCVNPTISMENDGVTHTFPARNAGDVLQKKRKKECR